MVFGFGPLAGEALVKHPDVKLVSFTGSTAVGRHVSQLCAPTFKKVSLEVSLKCVVWFWDFGLEAGASLSGYRETFGSCFFLQDKLGGFLNHLVH